MREPTRGRGALVGWVGACLAILLGLATSIAPLAASAWKQSKVPRGTACLAWQPREIEWSPALPLGGDLNAIDVLTAFRASFRAWEEPGCSDLRFVERPSTPRQIGYSRGGSNENVILFRDEACEELVPEDDPCWGDGSCGEVFDCWDFDERLIAVTTVTFSRCSGEILDADIELNSAAFRFTVVEEGPKCSREDEEGCIAMDLQNTMVHEIGHMIGLDHSPRKDAVMYANAALGETIKRRLSPDDERALCTVYPMDGETRTCGGIHGQNECAEDRRRQSNVGTGCLLQSGGAGGASLLALALVLLGLSRAGRRRRLLEPARPGQG